MRFFLVLPSPWDSVRAASRSAPASVRDDTTAPVTVPPVRASTPALRAVTFSTTCSRAAPTTAASNGRLSGFFSNSWQTSVSSHDGMSMTSRDGRSNFPCTCSRNICIALSASNGFFPVSSSYRTMPSEYRSDRWLRLRSPLHCSGDM